MNTIRTLSASLYTEAACRAAMDVAKNTKKTSGFTRVTPLKYRAGDAVSSLLSNSLHNFVSFYENTFPNNTERKWYLIDASGLTLGRLAQAIARKLSGKDKHTYSAHIDNGDFVIVTNIEKSKQLVVKSLKRVPHSLSVHGWTHDDNSRRTPYKETIWTSQARCRRYAP